MNPRFLTAGEHGVLVEFETLAGAVGFRAMLEGAPIAGVTDAVSGARTVLLGFDPAITGRSAVEAAAAMLASTAPGPGARTPAPGRIVEVPVVYDGEDLDELAARLGLTRNGLVAEHTGRNWTCAFGGFAPGFGYLVSDGPSLDVPRRAAPRIRVPPGAVGLAGEFSGIYPRASPGGWQLIGRTELPMWSLLRASPALLAVGTRVRFIPVSAK